MLIRISSKEYETEMPHQYKRILLLRMYTFGAVSSIGIS